MRFILGLGRWLSVPLVFVLLVLTGAWVSERLVRVLDGYCSPEAQVGGACVESWHTTGIEWVVGVGIFVTVLAAILLPSHVAPRGPRVVAVVAALLLVAVPIVAWLGLRWSDFLVPATIALLAAMAGVWRVWKREARR
jgi:uncharacterized membrane protein YjgN (DUF898 family)